MWSEAPSSLLSQAAQFVKIFMLNSAVITTDVIWDGKYKIEFSITNIFHLNSA